MRDASNRARSGFGQLAVVNGGGARRLKMVDSFCHRHPPDTEAIEGYALGLIFAPFTIKTAIFVAAGLLVAVALPWLTPRFFKL